MKVKSLIATSVLAASAVASSVAMAESPLTANIGFTSDYIWRGMPQSGDSAEIQGGIDYAHSSGLYVGTWVSSLDAVSQYEQDWYAGFGFDAGPVGLDVGYIMYTYPIGDAQSDFSEAYLNVGWEWLSAGVAYTVDTDWGGDDADLYYYVGAEFDIKDGLMLGLVYGNTDYDDAAAEDLAHYQVSLSKDDFTFALDQLDATDTGAGEDDMRFSVSWSKSFDL
jgi:uncharacterized protein (TIGR02001 family)